MKINNLLLALICCCSLGCSDVDDSEKEVHTQPVYWPGEPEYIKKVKEFSISPEEAHDMLLQRTTEHRHRFFDKNPILIVGDDYFFCEPRKFEIPLTGFYINGNDGSAEYRTSNDVISKDQKLISFDKFLDYQNINLNP
ncbi:hypothetical protein QSV34_15135 [Porticoccus sp. W117]|uniref:hypothetical protein n=1 Tax=Porticoccus sp. W117 TaxID=3054777 RepID=UPI0025984973|nr:hypothetical protein [Porticoccus sp. W117]MDM3872685.1 hypothetical protein [Porticoccus sp. W117]